jgi:hypothetical protein
MDPEISESASASPRSEAMRRAWVARKARAAAEAAWFDAPVCVCGCGLPLVRHKSPEKQCFYRLGHDAKLKSLARKVLRREADPAAIPEIARLMKTQLVFLRQDQELGKVF